MALTATASKALIKSITETLQFDNPVIIRKNPNRPNVYLEKKKRLDNVYGIASYNRILIPIAKELKVKKKVFPITIIYMRLKYCGYASILFEDIIGKSTERLFAQYHAPQTARMKNEILCDLLKEKSNIRVIFATSALGMGVNVPNAHYIIHIGPPSSLEAYVQEIGRAGRDGSPSKAILYYCNSDFSEKRLKENLITHAIIVHLVYVYEKFR